MEISTTNKSTSQELNLNTASQTTQTAKTQAGVNSKSTISSVADAETNTPATDSVKKEESKGICGTITSALSSVFNKIKDCFSWIWKKITCAKEEGTKTPEGTEQSSEESKLATAQK